MRAARPRWGVLLAWALILTGMFIESDTLVLFGASVAIVCVKVIIDRRSNT